MKITGVGVLLLVATGASAQTRVVELSRNDHAIAAQVQELWTVGRVEGAEWEVFTDVSSVAFTQDGGLVAVDRGANRVLQFDSTGAFLGYVGQSGRGPGEHAAPVGVAVTSDGMIAVGDAARRSILLYDGTRRFVRSVSLADTRALYPAMRAAPEGGVLIPQVSTTAVEPGAHVVYYHSLRPDARAEIRYRNAVPDAVETPATRNGTSYRRVRPPVFSPALRFAPWGNGRVLMASDATWTLTVAGSASDGIAVVRRRVAPRRVSEADKEAVRDLRRSRASHRQQGLANGFAIANPSGEALEARLRALQFAEHIPVIAALGVDSDGRVWVSRNGDLALTDGPIDVLSPQLEYLGTIRGATMPIAFGPRGRIARIAMDEYRVQSIVVERVTLP